MIVYDTRMVHGYPLQYYSYPPASYPVSYNQEYRKYNYYSMTEISEEMLLPSSPHSLQSDSDNSISSTDVSTSSSPQKPRINTITPTKTTPNTNEVTDVKCGWLQCGLWFESLDMLANHVSKAHAASGPNGLFYCGWEGCSRNNKGFNARYKMLVHVRTHTNQKPHQCCQCEKSFSRAENLKIHSRSHSGEKPYICPVPGCNKAYSNSSDRFKHTRTHQVEKPYLCKIPGCNKRYTDPSSLRKHVKTYKHFVNNEVKNQEPIVESTNKFENTNINLIQSNESNKYIIYNENLNVNQNFIKSENIYSNENLLNDHKCSCPHTCCLKSCLSKAAELLKLGALINFNGNSIENVTWNKLLDPLMQTTNKIYTNYSEQIPMDIDTPLDLTVHRK